MGELCDIGKLVVKWPNRDVLWRFVTNSALARHYKPDAKTTTKADAKTTTKAKHTASVTTASVTAKAPVTASVTKANACEINEGCEPNKTTPNKLPIGPMRQRTATAPTPRNEKHVTETMRDGRRRKQKFISVWFTFFFFLVFKIWPVIAQKWTNVE